MWRALFESVPRRIQARPNALQREVTLCLPRQFTYCKNLQSDEGILIVVRALSLSVTISLELAALHLILAARMNSSFLPLLIR